MITSLSHLQSLLSLGLVLGVLASSAWCATPADTPDVEKSYGELLQRAADEFRNGREGEAEILLATWSRRKQESADWHFELARRFIQVAQRFPAEGARTRRLAELALRQTQNAVRKSTASNPETAASAHELAGLINERFLGDLPAAANSYRAALQLAPEHNAATEALARLTGAQQDDTGGMTH